MANYCKEYGTYCEAATDLGFCSVTGCIKQNRVSNISIIPTVMITDVPMVEYAPVIRCKDCTEWQDDWGDGEDGRHFCAMNDRWTEADFYCADGERREKKEKDAVN